MDFAVPGDHRVKLKESEKKDKYFDLARELKKVTFILMVISIKGTEGLRNKRTSDDHPNYYTTEISQISKKSPGNLRRLDVTF